MFSSKDESKIRLQWLVLASIIFFVFPLMLFVWSLIEALYNKTGIQDFPMLYIAIFDLMAISTIYYFGLKKQGTKLLTLLLFIAPFCFFNGLPIGSGAKPIDFQKSMILVGMIALFLWWWIASYRLRGVNLKNCQQSP